MKKIITILILSVLVLSPLRSYNANAVISFDNSTFDNNADSQSTSHTTAHTVGSGSNRILWVGVRGFTDDRVTGVTYNGVSMTQITKRTRTGCGYLFMLVNPATGNNNVVVSMSPADFAYVTVMSYDGAAQTGQPDSFSGNDTASDIQAHATTTTVADNSWLVSFQYNGATQFATGTNSFMRSWNPTYGATVGADTNSPQTPAGDHAMTLTYGASPSYFNMLIASFSPVAATTTDTCTYTSGDWDVLEGDNCFITSEVYVDGSFNLIGSTTGQFGCADGVKVSAENFNFGTDNTTFDADCFAHH